MSENVWTQTALSQRDAGLMENWYIAALSKELGRRRVIQRIVYDQALALYRDKSGTVRSVQDKCLHRQALLSKGSLNENGELVCPYHGWTYDSSGTVVEVPSEANRRRGVAPKAGCLKTYAVVEQEGCIWVWMGSAEAKTALPPFRFPRINEAGFQHYFMITDFDNEVTHLVENFMDVPHTVFVHSGWFRNPSAKEVPIKVDTSRGEVLVTYNQKRDKIGFSNWILNPKREDMSHTDRFIMPNITRVDYNFGTSRSFVIVSQCTPVSTLRCRVYTAIIFRLGVMTPILNPFLRFYTRRVIQQDVQIMANQGRSFRLQPELDFHSTDADIVHIEIERLRKMGQDLDPRLKSFEKSTERTIWI